MIRRILVSALLFILAVACQRASRRDTSMPDMPELEGRGDLRAKELRVIEDQAGKVPAVAIQLDLHGKDAPTRLKNDLAAGRSWLYLVRPVGFSFAVIGHAQGESAFRAESGTITFAQQAESNIVVSQGEAPPLEPALIRLKGELPLARGAEHLKTIEDPGLEIIGLGAVKNENMRVLLGRGMDNALAMANKSQGGVGRMDTHEFVAVVGAEGKAVADWEAHLEEAIRTGTFDPLDGDSMVVRRWRPGAAQRATYFKVAFPHLLRCAHMKIEPVAGGFKWTWEGIYGCYLRKGPAEGVGRVLDKAPPIDLVYKAYEKSSKDSSRTIWRTMFTPIALGVDFGGDMLKHLVDPEAEGSMFTR